MKGMVTAVAEQRVGSTLVTLAGTTLTVEHPGDFDQAGGSLLIGAEVIAYTVTLDVDGNPASLALASAPTGTYVEGDAVLVYPTQTERVAYIAEPGEGEELEARVPHALYDRLAVGTRDDDTSELVDFDFSEDELVILDVIATEPVVDGSYIESGTVAVTDGIPPTASPTPTVSGGPGYLVATWDPVANDDLVIYEVYVSATTGFTPTGAEKVGEVAGTAFVLTELGDGSPLAYDTTYYVKLIARDPDGAAAAGTQGSAQMERLTVPAIEQIDFSDIAGQATDAQLAGLSAAKVTGQLTDAQVAALSAAKLTGTIVETQIADNAITTAKIAANTIVAGDIAADTITAGQIAASAITATELAAGAVVAGKIAAGTIVAADIAAGVITADRLLANTLTANEIAANAITSSELAANAVVAGKIAAGTIVAGDIAAGAITTAKIFAGAVTANEIASGAVTATKISVATLDAITVDAGTITAGTFRGTTFETSSANPKVRMDTTGIFVTDSAGTKLARIDTAGGINLEPGSGSRGTVHQDLNWKRASDGFLVASQGAFTLPGNYARLEIEANYGDSFTSSDIILRANGSGGDAEIFCVATGAPYVRARAGVSQTKNIIVSDGTSDFMQLISTSRVRVKFGSVSITGTGTRSASASVTHGLGTTPTYVLVSLQTNNDMVVSTSTYGGTTFNVLINQIDGLTFSSSRSVIWMAVVIG